MSSSYNHLPTSCGLEKHCYYSISCKTKRRENFVENLIRCYSLNVDTVRRKRGKQMSSGWEGDVGRASNYTEQWRPSSYPDGHKLRPPSRTLWTDPDYLSGPNPQRPVVRGHFSPKKDSLQWTEIPRHCAPKLWKLSSQWGLRRKRDPKSSHFPHPPTLPIVTLGKAKEPSLILGILLNILGLAAAPIQSLCSPSC